MKITNSIVRKALNAAGEGRDYYVIDEFGNVADGSKTPLPFSSASALFLKLTGSKSGNGKWGIVRKGEPASKARDWYGNIVSWNAARARNAVVQKALNACRAARNADFPIVKFEVGKIYRAPWDRDWLAKVLSRTDSSIKVAIKSVRDKTWHKADEQVTLRINPRKSEEQGAEVARGWDWEFWADERAM